VIVGSAERWDNTRATGAAAETVEECYLELLLALAAG
jgi:hypothetical protein